MVGWTGIVIRFETVQSKTDVVKLVTGLRVFYQFHGDSVVDVVCQVTNDTSSIACTFGRKSGVGFGLLASDHMIAYLIESPCKTAIGRVLN